MPGWQKEIRKVFDPSDRGVKTHNIIFLYGDRVRQRTYGGFRLPVCEMYQAVVAEFEEDFDIISYYTDREDERRKRGLNFYKGKEYYLSMCENPPEPPQTDLHPEANANPYFQACIQDYNNLGYLKGMEEGVKDRTRPEATYYEDKPGLMVEQLDRFLFGQKDKKALIIFDDWQYWDGKLLYNDPNTRMNPKEETLRFFRGWAQDRKLLDNGHLIVILSNKNPLEKPDRFASLAEVTRHDCFSGNKSKAVEVPPFQEKDIYNAVMGAHFKRLNGFYLESETEAKEITALLEESDVFKQKGLEVLLDLGVRGNAWNAKQIADELQLCIIEENMVTLDDVIGYMTLKKKLLEAVTGVDATFSSAYEIIGGTGSSRSRGVILAGPGGCGKSFMGTALAGTMKKMYGREWQLFRISSRDLTSKYRGESEERIVNTFNRIKSLKKAIIIWDEAESYLTGASFVTGGGAEREDNKARAALLRAIEELDALMKKDNRRRYFWVVSTNNPSIIDIANRRRLSNEVIYFVGLPDFNTRKLILKHIAEKESGRLWNDQLIEFAARHTRGVTTDTLSKTVYAEVQKLLAQMFMEQELKSSEELSKLKIDYKRIEDMLRTNIPRAEGTNDYHDVLENCRRAKCLLMEDKLT